MNMYPVLFRLGIIKIYSWGTMLFFAFIFGLLIAIFLSKREGLKLDDVLCMFAIILLSSLVGSRLFYVIFHWHEFEGNFLKILSIWDGGADFYGAIFVTVVAIFLYVKLNNLSLLKVLDAGTPAVIFGYSIVRIGCFLNGCCYGIIPNLQLYSSLSVFIIFLILLQIYKRKKFDGEIFFAGMVLYPIYRFGIEFLRVGQRFFGLTIAQIISVFVFILGSYWLFIKKSISL